MQHDAEHPPQGALRQAGRQRRLAGLGAAVGRRCRWSLCRRADAQETAMTPEDGGYFVHRQAAGRGRACAYCFKLADGREYPDPASRWQPEGVHRPSAVFFPESLSLVGRGLARRRPRGPGDLRVARRRRSRRRARFDAIMPRLPELRCAGRDGDRADAGGPVRRRPQLGLRRRLSLRRAEQLRRARGPCSGWSMPPISAGLAVILDVVYNHFGPEGNYLGQLRPLFHRPLPHAVGQGRSITTGRTATPVRQFVIDNACGCGCAIFTSTACGSTRSKPSTTSARGTSWPRFRRPCRREAARAGRSVHVIAETNQNDVRLVRPRGPRRLRAGRRVERRFPPQRPRPVDRRARRLLPGFRPAGAAGQGLQRRVRLRRLLQPVSPPPPRQPRGRDRPHAVRRLHPEPRPGGKSRREAIAWARSLPPAGAAAGVRPAVALAVRAAVVHGRGIRRDAAVSRSSARSAIRR